MLYQSVKHNFVSSCVRKNKNASEMCLCFLGFAVVVGCCLVFNFGRKCFCLQDSLYLKLNPFRVLLLGDPGISTI